MLVSIIASWVTHHHSISIMNMLYTLVAYTHLNSNWEICLCNYFVYTLLETRAWTCIHTTRDSSLDMYTHYSRLELGHVYTLLRLVVLNHQRPSPSSHSRGLASTHTLECPCINTHTRMSLHQHTHSNVLASTHTLECPSKVVYTHVTQLKLFSLNNSTMNMPCCTHI
jgi:hypothetical protein